MYDDDEDLGICNQCGGPMTLLGNLGGIRHLRCRNCGWDDCVPIDVPLDFDGDILDLV